ncbi:MAG: PAS domain-containing protein [Nitrospinaceae bacterium]|jgi:PAS domain-containing protein|nr:PAS domain-containing protein [Nitrospinaceae bacterium]MBT3434085.1 PAS domain-containing protein [Nitrospinaceae bacterium]MBT3822838.1 PAS domain-containing protein [Nitrospinaceae bacterium]MBT4094047.1 PAS domain-containing protein [Nitrospinaceae bacterium]MBT4431426.1 PAS domain-containing protein [Nitrospinaceae bacterium]
MLHNIRTYREIEINDETQKVAQIGVWERNIQTADIFWSNELYRFFGFVPEEIRPVNEVVWQRIHPDDLDLVRKAYWVAVNSGLSYENEFRVILPGGGERVINSKCQVMSDETGKPIRSISSSRNISNLR